MDYDKFLTKVSRKREFSQLRELGKYMVPGYHMLAGGIPTPDIFHFTEATFSLRDGGEIEIDEEFMEIAQQYGSTQGYQPLLKLIQSFTERLHSPPSDDWAMTMTSGCQDGMFNAMDIILEEGDSVIGGDYCYSGALDIARPQGVNYLSVESDEYGMKPDALLRVLSRWTPEFCRRNKSEAPKMIYFVPNGGNPDSVTITAERRRQIYKIAQDYDLLILEDDPYYFMIFAQERPPSFLSLDTDGRVLRCDSISKTIAPGFRLGTLTAARPFVDAAVKRLQVSSQQPCCLSQVLVYKLLLKLGFEGFVKKAEGARNIMRMRKDTAERYVKKWLADLVEMNAPSGGFFLWIKLKGIEDSEEICKKCNSKKAIFAPGTWFTFDLQKTPYIRVSYSSATEEDFDKGFRILAETLRDHHKATKNGHISNGIYDTKDSRLVNGKNEA